MKRIFWIVLTVLSGLGFAAGPAAAGGDDFYAGANLYIARTNATVYDCARPGCGTAIRLRQGSYIYAVCWDGGEGWCRIQTKFFKNMFLPRYAVDYAYGFDGYGNKYKDCAWKERYSSREGYGEGCYDKGYYPRRHRRYKGDCYGRSGYGEGAGGCYSSEYGQKRRYGAYGYSKSYGYRKNGYSDYDGDGNEGYDQDD